VFDCLIILCAWIHTYCDFIKGWEWEVHIKWKQKDKGVIYAYVMKGIYWNQFSGAGNIVHLAVYNNVDGVLHSSNMNFCVCPALWTNRDAASLGEKGNVEKISELRLWKFTVSGAPYITGFCIVLKLCSVIYLFPISHICNQLGNHVSRLQTEWLTA
jgi:hypothetical protein